MKSINIGGITKKRRMNACLGFESRLAFRYSTRALIATVKKVTLQMAAVEIFSIKKTRKIKVSENNTSNKAAILFLVISTLLF